MRFDDRMCLIVLGILLIMAGISNTYYVCYSASVGYPPDLSYYSDINLLVSIILMYVVGVAILLARNRIVLRQAAAMTSVVIGVWYLGSLPQSGLDPLDFLGCVLFTILGATLVVFGVLLFFGKTRDATTISYMALLIVAYDVLQYIVDSWECSIREFFTEIIFLNGANTVLFFFFAYVLLRPGIRIPGMITVMTNNARRVMDTEHSAPDTYLEREDLMVVLDMIKPSENWVGALRSERSVTLHGSQGNRVLELRRWDGDEVLRATVASESGSLNGYTFGIVQAIPRNGGFEDCESVRFYDEDGFFTDINIFDPPVSYKDSLLTA